MVIHVDNGWSINCTDAGCSLWHHHSLAFLASHQGGVHGVLDPRTAPWQGCTTACCPARRARSQPSSGDLTPHGVLRDRKGVLVGRIANLRRPALRLSSPARSLGCIRAYLANRRATVVLSAPIPGFATRLELDGFNVRTGHDVMATLISQGEGGHRPHSLFRSAVSREIFRIMCEAFHGRGAAKRA